MDTAGTLAGARCLYDNEKDGDEGLAIYEFDTDCAEKHCEKIFLWFIGTASPLFASHQLIFLSENI